jgi:hypothetical protein
MALMTAMSKTQTQMLQRAVTAKLSLMMMLLKMRRTCQQLLQRAFQLVKLQQQQQQQQQRQQQQQQQMQRCGLVRRRGSSGYKQCSQPLQCLRWHWGSPLLLKLQPSKL